MRAGLIAMLVSLGGCGGTNAPDYSGSFAGVLDVLQDAAPTTLSSSAVVVIRHGDGTSIRVDINGCTIVFDSTGVTDPSDYRGAGFILAQPMCNNYALTEAGLLITDPVGVMHVETRINIETSGQPGAPPQGIAQWYFRGDRQP